MTGFVGLDQVKVPGDEPDFFERMFPKRDPITGEQGGILANPLFRIGMSLLARSGPQKNPTNLGQIIAGSVSDLAQSRMEDEQAATQFIQNQKLRKGWKEELDQDSWASDLDVDTMLKGANPTGDPSALKAQAPAQAMAGTPATSYYHRLAGLESNHNPNAKNTLGSASGRFQFIDSTRAWVDKQLNLNPADRSEATEQKRIEYFTNVNTQNLKMHGLPDNDTNKYFTHLLGSKGGVDFIKMAMQAPNHPAESVLPEKVVRANAKIFQGRTLGEVYGIIERSIAQGKWDFGGQREEAPAPQMGSFSSQPSAPAQFPPSPTFKPQEFGGAQNALPSQPPAEAVQTPNPAMAVAGAAPQTTAQPAGGPVQGAEGMPQASPMPPLVPGPNGTPTKASILQALEALPLPEKNQLVLGAWLEAKGNKRLFAENLGKALLARSRATSASEAGNYIVGAPFPVLNKDGEIETWIIRRDGTRENITAEINGRVVNRSTMPEFDPNDEYDREAVKRVAEYKESPRIFGKPGTPRYDTMMAEVRKLRPDFLEKEADNVTKAIRSYTTGQESAQIGAMSTVVSHLAHYEDALKALKNGQIPLFNQIMNYLGEQFGFPELPVAKTTGVVVADEVVRALIRGVGALTDRQQVQALLNTNYSPEQAPAVAEQLRSLISDRLLSTKKRFTAATRGLAEDRWNEMFSPRALQYMEGLIAETEKKAQAKDKAKTVVPRKPGETIQDYMKRTGG